MRSLEKILILHVFSKILEPQTYFCVSIPLGHSLVSQIRIITVMKFQIHCLVLQSLVIPLFRIVFLDPHRLFQMSYWSGNYFSLFHFSKPQPPPPPPHNANYLHNNLPFPCFGRIAKQFRLMEWYCPSVSVCPYVRRQHLTFSVQNQIETLSLLSMVSGNTGMNLRYTSGGDSMRGNSMLQHR